jgi:uncharacterized repeat protein (TIGR03837 family)
MSFPENLDLFCRVVDNFGDVGVCWRLARQFAHEYGIAVTLWVDDLTSFHKICRQVDPASPSQQVAGVLIRHWSVDGDVSAHKARYAPGAAVIEAFGCQLPPAFIAAMAAMPRQPVWMNLEYLSAESWVEGCHAMVSPQSGSHLLKYFYFPGFSAGTGGLLAERDLVARRDAFQSDASAQARLFNELGVTLPPGARKVSLFCYPHAPVSALLDAMAAMAQPTVCLIPEGVAAAQVAAFMGCTPEAGAHATRGALTVHVLPFIDQDQYDQLLWACDVNFVRGEDSFVRAQWAARPFVWQIYPQEENAHAVKLDAFLARYTASMPDALAGIVCDAWRAWNAPAPENAGFSAHWSQLCQVDLQLLQYGRNWAQFLAGNGDLAANLLQYIQKIG